MTRMTNTDHIYTAQKTVSASGTPEQLTAFPVPDGCTLMIQAMGSNTGTITIGYSSATALNSGTSHTKLLPNQTKGFQVANANYIYIDSTVSGDGVEIFCESNY